MPVGNICNGISFRHDDSVLRSFSGAVRGGCRHNFCTLVPDPVEYIGWLPLDPFVNNFQAYSSQMQYSPSTKIRTVPDNERTQDQIIVG